MYNQICNTIYPNITVQLLRILIGQGVVYKSHIDHVTWLISAAPHIQCPYGLHLATI